MFIKGERVNLRPLTSSDVGETWLSWLNDPVVLRYRGPKAFPSTLSDIHRYLGNQNGDLRLAICSDKSGHIGNITLGSINWVHRSAELNIMLGIGRGEGFGKDAIGSLVNHAFSNMGLLRVWAESPNPAFIGAVCSLGWTKEGIKRKAFLLKGEFIDIECWAILKGEEKLGALNSRKYPPIFLQKSQAPPASQASEQGREAARLTKTAPTFSGLEKLTRQSGSLP